MTTVKQIVEMLQPVSHSTTDDVQHRTAWSIQKQLERFSFGTPLSRDITTLEEALAIDPEKIVMREDLVVDIG